MDRFNKIYVAGHYGMVGSSIVRHQLDVTRISQLGWKAKTSLEDGIVKAHQDYKRLTV